MIDEGGDLHATRAEEALSWLNRLRSSRNLDDQAAFEAWFGADPANADAYETALARWDEMARVATTPIGKSRQHFYAVTRRRQHGYAMLAAAAVALFALLGVGGLSGDSGTVSAAYASRLGEIRTVRLPDGSRVTLDTDTVLTAAFTAGKRHLLLVRGRARFDVVKDPSRPFVIRAGLNSVTATGTVFDVGVFPGSVSVVSLSGSVDVRSVGQALLRHIAAGQSVTISPTTDINRLSETADLRWVSGMLSFENARLSDVIEASNRYTAKKIITSDPKIQSLPFTGTFRPKETDALARMLATTFRLSLTRDDRDNYVLVSGGS
ncbi:FecR family protein [Sphingomonas sp. UYP23]